MGWRNKFIEDEVAEKITDIVVRTLNEIHKLNVQEIGKEAFQTLERLTKIYAILKDDVREDVKAKLITNPFGTGV